MKGVLAFGCGSSRVGRNPRKVDWRIHHPRDLVGSTKQKKQMLETMQNGDEEQAALMERYSISFDGVKYQVGGYQYDRLDDAVNIARAQDKKSNSAEDTRRESYSVDSAYISGAPVQSKYGVASGISVLLTVVGWLGFVAGLFILLTILLNSKGDSNSELTLLPGLGLVVSGFLYIAVGQVIRATVDSADNTREILKLLKEQA